MLDSGKLAEFTTQKTLDAVPLGDNSEVDLGNLLIAQGRAHPSTQQIEDARDIYVEYQQLIDLAVRAADIFENSSAGRAHIKRIETQLQNGDENVDIHDLIESLIANSDFQKALDIANAMGIKAVGLGVAASFNLLFAGLEKGIEGILLLPDNAYGVLEPKQYTSRGWTTVTGGIDVLASAGISMSFWFKEPAVEAIVGIAVDLIPIVGARFSYIKTKDKPEERPTLPIQKPNATFAGFSLRLSVGLELGALVFAGGQKVPAGRDILPDKPVGLMTLVAQNPATGTSVVEIGQTAALNVTLIPPENAPSGDVTLVPNETHLTLTLPSFLSSNANVMTVSDITPALWTLEPDATNGALVFVYSGDTEMVWSETVTLTLGNVTSSSTEEETAKITASVDGCTYPASAGLSLVALVFKGVIDWNIELANGMILAPDAPQSGTAVEICSPPTGFVQLSKVIDTTTSTDGTAYKVGYQFRQEDSDGTIVPMIQAFFWKDDTSWPKGQKYSSPPTTVTQTPITMEAPFKTSSITKLIVTAKLTD